MDLTRLGRTERVLAVVGVLALIDSFLPWYSVSGKGLAAGISYSENAWDVGVGGWFPLLLLLAVGVVVALPAAGRSVVVRGGYAAFGAAAALATLIILIRWLTYPSLPGEAAGYADAGAGFGTYAGLILAVVATVFAYLAFTAAGGSIAAFGDAFKVPADRAAPQGQPAADWPQAPGETPAEWRQPPQQ